MNVKSELVHFKPKGSGVESPDVGVEKKQEEWFALIGGDHNKRAGTLWLSEEAQGALTNHMLT